MNKVKIKVSGRHKPNRNVLLQVLAKFKIKCSRLNEISSEKFIIECNDADDTDQLFSVDCIKALACIDCRPVLPPDVKAKRTVILRRLDNHIYQQNEDDIVREIQSENSWSEISSIFKYPKFNSVKITFVNQKMAQKACENGLLIFHLSVPPSHISIENFIMLQICYKCYSYEDHPTSLCKKPKDFSICSLCATVGYNHKVCDSSMKMCINCGEAHGTLSMSCPHRRSIIKAKRKKDNSLSYSAAASGSRSADGFLNTSAPLNEIIAKSTMCVVVAALKNAEQPGTFCDTMTELLSANNLPRFSLGKVEPPNLKFHNTEQAMQEEPTSEGTPHELPKMTIYKRKGTSQVTPNNIKTIYDEGNLYIDAADMTPNRTIQLLSRVNAKNCNFLSQIPELKSKDFEQLTDTMPSRSKRQPKQASNSSSS